ncbi:hypothetical protein COY90_04300 [Candidatus Roizmanbacteria bacterium CG_4_10_14_0_8_um_filter_39_9]|uniref:50S ribosomal protein L29 n=1 Tax=Candidatus Roizmanbacteria bacterium CG_4_10_14_0_8_um_filter_39_9 TaxID=1974829 RepID=A0A2M7QBZ9_9BACT|nr:MAG: hypothetical protein COY90_04300 [Candidatus Roizmanbacteria bacterium CG_4_10_14_0_8_um_filter_39_9]
MKKYTKEISDKTIGALKKEEVDLRLEIGKLTVEATSNPQKDTNALVKKKKRLAVVLTFITKKTSEAKIISK